MNAARSFAKFRTDVFRLHDDGRYDEALDLVEREGTSYPEETSGITYWRICLLAGRGDTSGALKEMVQAVESGWWRGEPILRQDRDLAQLQGVPAFERLVKTCRSRQEAAQSQTRPTMKVLTPKEAAPPNGYPLMIALHGFGGNVADFSTAWAHLPTRGWLVMLPQASEVVDFEGYAWWDHEKAGREIDNHFAALRASHRIDPSGIVLAGYSQGGVMASWLALQDRPVQARGVLGIVPGLRDADTFANLAKGHADTFRVYVLIGSRDLAVERVRRFAHLFQSAGFPTKVEEQPELDHEIPTRFDEVTVRALEFIMAP
jgi:predicted esterase